MRLLTKTVFAFLPALILAGASAEAATENWRHSCVGPDVACSSSQATPAGQKAATAPAKLKAATKGKAKKPAATASENAASKPKKAKKIARSQDDDASPVKPKKAKKVAKAQDDDEAPVKAKKKAKVATKKNSDGDTGGNSYQSGVASWYGGYFHGRTTANGEKYDMWAMTAAHKTLPFGTRVKVTNTGNGDSTIVRINDRGPFIAGRVIDLSKAAANDIGMGGLAKVKLTILGKG